MLCDIIYEQKGMISWYRVLDTESPTIETTITNTDIINGVEVTDIITYWSQPSPSSSSQDNEKVFYAEGQGIITSKDGIVATHQEWRNALQNRIIKILNLFTKN